MDGGTFRVWACLMYQRSDHLIEGAMIAAMAMVCNLIVVTRNVRNIDPFGIDTLNPFAPASTES